MSTKLSPLSGKTAVILGGTGGIGLAVSRLFAEAGARVAVVASQARDKAERVAISLPGQGHFGYACRIENSDELTVLAKDVQVEMGGARILVNAAGFTRSIPHADLDAMDDETFDRILAVNTRAAFAAIRTFAPQLRTGSDGLVVNLSSIAATTAVGSCIAYCAAKAGMDVMGAAIARVLAPEIRILTVSPGVVDTDFVPGRDQLARQKISATTPLKRLCTPEDVAETVLACATLLRFSTGSIIQIDGGRHLV
jgi:NAD(P)-dependent dehydrogenase (short-subunit alcohol dehydrogenase family)